MVSLLTKDELVGIAKIIIGASTSDLTKIQIQQTATDIIRVANSRILSSDNGARVSIRVETSHGSRVRVSLDTNAIDEKSLRRSAAQLDALAREQYGSPFNYANIPFGPQQYLPVHLWHDTTADAMGSIGETVVPNIIQRVNEAGLLGAGFVGLMARATLAMYNDGLLAFERDTDCECTVSARTQDGKSSGWAGRADRDWSNIRWQDVADEAIDMAKRGVGAQGYEPGRRTAILSPYAVAQVVRHMSKHFDAYWTNVLGATAFSVRGDPNRRNKVGLRVFDERLRFSSDPADPDGGFLPFMDTRADAASLPQPAIDWVEQGVLKRLAYHVYYGLEEGQPYSQNPWSLRVDTTSGTAHKTVEEMIAACDEGVYVHRFSNVSQVHATSGMQTGVTRDGCFLIKNGKIDRPLINYRFLDSPFMYFNRLLAIGKSERTALGFTEPAPGEPPYASDWPRRPLIVPPVMVQDFNFNALATVV